MSPAATLSDSDAALAVQQAADQLFYKHGVVAVSMAQIRDASGVSMRRLYQLCPSKADLVSLWLNYRHLTWTAGLKEKIDSNLADGQRPIDAIFAALSSWMTETNFRGCGFINTHTEASELTAQHSVIIANHKRSVADYLSTLVPHGDLVAVLVDGAIVQASIFASAEPIELARLAALALPKGTL